MDDTRLQGRHIVVTGGAQGIGQGITVRAAQAGADVTIFDINRSESALIRIRVAGGRRT